MLPPFHRHRGLRHLAPVAVVIAALLTVVAPPIDASSQIFPYEVHVETLDNGLQVMLIPMSSNGLAAYWSIVRTGARDEYEPGHTGFAHFFEHMMFRGSKKFPRDVRERMITRMGADGNAFTSDDMTCYYLNVASEDLDTVIELESDRFLNLSYSETDFKTEAGAVYGEYRKNRSNPFFAIYEAIHQAAFEKHTYGHTAMGYVEDIKAMPTMYAYSQKFFQRYYRPENVLLLVIGDFDREHVLQSIRRSYGPWERGYTPPQVPAEPEQQAEKRIEVPYEGQSLPILWLAYKVDAFAPDDPLYVGANLLCELAFGETSAIHKKLVLEEQVVEFIDADVNFNRDPGLLDIVTRIKDPTKIDYVLEEIDQVITRFREHAPDAQRLQDLKSRLKYDFLMGLDTPQNVARSLYRILAVTGDPRAVDTLYRTFEQVRPEDVKASAVRYLQPRHRTIAVLRGGES